MKLENSFKNYTILEKLFENKKSIIFRASKKTDNRKYIIKVLNTEFPNEEEISSFLYENETLKNMEIEGTPKVHEILDIESTKALVFYDFHGTSLNKIDFDSLLLSQKLMIFNKVLEILEKLHTNKIIHKDINPSNIIFNEETNYVGLIDFENSSKLSEEKVSFNKTLLEGTLDYISPEQTGRINRAVDYRSDLYSVGASFYEIFSGEKLFPKSKDLLELIYFHVAKEPKELKDINKNIPVAISNIIKKLLSKNVEDRYQSAYGVKEDINFCLESLQKHKYIKEFEIAQKDKMTNFFISQKNYGRDEVLNSLYRAYNRSSLSGFETILISGEKGSGKSSIASELQSLVMKNKGTFNYGKFKKSNINFPYGALELFSTLVKNLLSEDFEVIEKRKTQILNAVGNNGKLLFDFIPELKYVIGEQEEPELLPPTETKNRLIFTFIEFLKVFMDDNNPLIIFLDDCQFANETSIEISKALVSQIDLKNLLLIFSYDKESEKSTLKDFIDFMKTHSKSNVQTIELYNLSFEDIKNLLIDSTKNKIHNLESLATIIKENTKGLPLLVKEYIKILYNREILYFKNDKFLWNEADAKNLKLLNEEDLVNDLFSLCTEEEYELLKTLTTFGETFSYDIVETVLGKDDKKLVKLLNELLSKGVIQFEKSSEKKYLHHNHFSFSSATLFQLIEKELNFETKKNTHILIGKTLLNIIENTKDESSLFEALSHLNWIIDTEHEKEYLVKLADLNYKAGLISRNNSAFKGALNYFEIAFELYTKLKFIPEGLFLNLCETSYSSSEYNKMNRYFSIGEKSIKNSELRLKLIEIRIYSLLAEADANKAVDFSLDILKTLGIDFPKKVEQKHILTQILKIKYQLIGKKIENLSNLPLMTNSHWLGIMRILSAASVSSYLVSQEHFMLIAMKQLELSLKHGNAPQSSFAYTTYGVILCGALGDLDNGYKFGKEALNLLDRVKTNEYSGRTTVCANLFNLHWKDPINQIYKELNKAYDIAMKSGDVEFAAWALLCRDFHGFFSSKNLQTLQKDMTYSTKRIKFELKQESQYYTSNSFLCLVEHLTGSVDKEIIDTEQALQNRFEKENYKNGLYYNYSNSMIKNLIFGDYIEAYNLSKKADLCADSVISTINVPAYYFYSSLSFLLANGNPSKIELKQLNKKIKALKKFGNFAPNNHLYKYSFVNALYEVTVNKNTVPFKTFDEIIKNCLKNGFIADGALLNEIVAIIAKKSGNDTLSNLYISSAIDLYSRWGAYEKVSKLSEKYSIYNKHTTTLSGSIKNGVGSLLDSSSLIKLTTLLTAENQYDKLISKLTEIVMENAGAERGFFVSKKNNELFVEREFSINDKSIKQSQNSIESYGKNFGKSIVNYVCRTGELFLLDGHSHNSFNDEYLLNTPIKSLLVIPVVAQNKIMGAFYLENNLISEVFTKQRIETLKLIALQGAIAIENIKIYSTLEEKVKERTSELNLANKKLEEQKQEAEKAKNIANEATRIKSEFLANMSHEIRTPMNGVMGLTYLLRKTNLNERQSDYLNKIEDSAKHLLNVINDILDFSKVEAGKIELDKRNFKIENIFSNISNIFVKPIEDKGLELIQYIDPKIPKYLIGDDVRLKQSLINIIGNAVKFTHKGEILIKVLLSSIIENKATILFSIQDTGIGLSPEQKNKLFKSFTQADGSITRKYGGTGLGLAISKNFVELMGGNIGVVSEPNKGSNFYFELTFNIGETHEKADLYNLKGLKTLIVDDSETSLEILKAYMENYGCIVDTCYSGKDAIDLLESSKNDPYKLLLIDWKMPEMDGLETISYIKNNDHIPELPLIIMVSAFNIDEIKEEGNKLNVNGYLTKPIQQSSLLDTILLSLGVNIENFDKNVVDSELENLKGNVLLVEDNLINQVVAKEILESFGLDVTIVDNGLHAIDLAKNNEFALIFMDIQMPGIDGYETTKQIKELGIKTPIIAMTANVLESDVQKCKEAGMEDYIGKPIDPDKLHEILTNWISFHNKEQNIGSQELPEYAGININSGLRRAMGKLNVFNKVLNIFLTEFSSAPSKINLMIENEDKDGLLRYLHTLKGASGNISAELLYEKTIILESKVKDWTFSKEDLNLFFRELSLVLKNKDLLIETALNEKNKNLNEEALKFIYNDLILLKNELKSASFNSESIFETIERRLENYSLKEFEEIKKAILNFEYEKAYDMLNKFLKTLKIQES